MYNRISMLNRRRSNADTLNVTGTFIGFMLFLSGALLFLYALLDIVVRLDSVQTVLYFVFGGTMYKIGQSVLNYFATSKSHNERRRKRQI